MVHGKKKRKKRVDYRITGHRAIQPLLAIHGYQTNYTPTRAADDFQEIESVVRMVKDILQVWWQIWLTVFSPLRNDYETL